MYVNGSKVSTSSGPSSAIDGLACGKSYTVGVEARTREGTCRPAPRWPCRPVPAPPRPSRRVTRLHRPRPRISRWCRSRWGPATVKWDASSDNVGVVAYTVYNGSNAAGDTPGTNFVVSSVTCGTTVPIGVEAKDAAGNRSREGHRARRNASLRRLRGADSTGHAHAPESHGDEHHGQLGRVERQPRRRRLRGLPGRHASRDRRDQQLHLRRARVWEELHARRGRRGRLRPSLAHLGQPALHAAVLRPRPADGALRRSPSRRRPRRR